MPAQKACMGAVLLQDESPIAYASKSLTQCQQNYAQIEKELLAIVFGCTRFHDYIYGIPNVEVETDHKPLESILKKPLHQAPTRLQKMIMTLQRYSITVRYRPGKELTVADALSRAPLPSTAPEPKEPPYAEYDVNTLTPAISKARLDQICQASQTDPSLQAL